MPAAFEEARQVLVKEREGGLFLIDGRNMPVSMAILNKVQQITCRGTTIVVAAGPGLARQRARQAGRLTGLTTTGEHPAPGAGIEEIAA